MANALFTRRYNTNLRQSTVVATTSIFKSLSTGSYKVTAIGGGGGNGGSDGEITSEIIQLTEGQSVECYIGDGGKNIGTSGGLTAFGNYLIANGGSGNIYISESIDNDNDSSEFGNGGKVGCAGIDGAILIQKV